MSIQIESTSDAPSYDVQLHRRAERELSDVPEPDRSRLRDAIIEASRHKEPTEAPKVKILSEERLFRVRIGGWRAIVKLDSPYLLVLEVTEREGAYDADSIKLAKSRLSDFDHR